MRMNKHNFAWPITAQDREDIDAFEKWFKLCEHLLKDHTLAIWGAGIRGTAFSILLKEKKFTDIVFVDINSEKQGGTIDEFSIISPEQLYAENADKYIILVSVENSKAIEKNLDDHGYRNGVDYFTAKTEQYDEYTKEFTRQCSDYYMFVGDCEFSSIALRDTDRNNLREKIYQRFGKENAKVLAMHGMGLRAHYNIIMAQINMGLIPSVLAIQVNFDTLTGMQHLLPRSQHTELLEKLLEVQREPSEEFEEYVNITRERSKNIKMEFFSGGEETGAVTENKARNYLRLNYMYELDINTEGIIYLSRLLDEMSAQKITVIPFIPPVNYQLAEKFFGDDFSKRYSDNVRKIRELVESKGFDLLDMSYELTSDLFAGLYTPSETANSAGRDKVADILFNAVMERSKNGTGNN